MDAGNALPANLEKTGTLNIRKSLKAASRRPIPGSFFIEKIIEIQDKNISTGNINMG